MTKSGSRTLDLEADSREAALEWAEALEALPRITLQRKEA